MNLSIIVITCIAISGIIKFYLIPRIENSIPNRKLFAKLKKMSWLAGLNYLQRLLLTAAITYCFILLIFFVFHYLIKSNVENVHYLEAFFQRIDGWQEMVKNTKGEKYLYTLSALVVIFLILVIRSARRYGTQLYKDLLDKQSNGTLTFIEPTTEMKQIEQDVLKAKQDLIQYHAIEEESLTRDELNQKEYVTSILEKLIPEMEEKLKVVDIERRIDYLYLKDEKLKKTKRFSLGKFFLSERMTHSIYKSGRYLNLVSIGLFLITLLSASSSQIETSLLDTKKEIVTIQLQFQEEEQNTEWEKRKALLKNVESKEWTEEDEETLDEIVIQYERSLISARFPNINITPDKTSFDFRSNAVKETILNKYSQKGSQFNTNQYQTYHDGSKASKDFSKAYNDILNNKTPNSNHSKAVREDLSFLFKSDYKKWNKVKNQFRSSKNTFSKFASTSDLAGKILGEAVSGGSDIFKPDGSYFNDFFESYSKKATDIWYKAKGKKFVVDLETKTYGEAMNNIAKNDKIYSPNFSSITNTSASSPIKLEELGLSKKAFDPSIDYASKVDANKAITTMTKISKANNSVLNGPISEYKYYFPGNDILASQTKPMAARLVAKLGQVDDVFFRGSSRSRNFVKLNKFKRVGGVLIGRKPKNHGLSGLNFTDIDFVEYALDNDKIIFELKREDGVLIKTNPVERSVAIQALAYAADGRQVAVTMVPAEPFTFLKILLHPALVDTELGCNSIALDRFVDKYSYRDSRVEESLSYYNFQKLVYTYLEVKSFINYNSPANSIVNADEFDPVINALLQQLDVYYESGYDIAEEKSFLNNSNNSFIKANSSFFDKETIKQCNNILIRSGGSLEHFLEIANTISYKNETFDLPEMEYWSGVREREYSVDNELSFLFQRNPLRFMSHIICEKVDDYSSNHIAWEMPNLKNNEYLNNVVLGEVKKSYAESKIFSTLNDFTVTQRLFKAILNGNLGDRFPIEKLIDIIQELDSSSSVLQTPDWNMNLSREEYSMDLNWSLKTEKEVDDILELWDLFDVDQNSMLTLCK